MPTVRRAGQRDVLRSVRLVSMLTAVMPTWRLRRLSLSGDELMLCGVDGQAWATGVCPVML